MRFETPRQNVARIPGAKQSLAGLGDNTMVTVPMLLLLIAAWYIVRGKRR